MPLTQAMIDIAGAAGQLRTTKNVILLLQCLHQATHPWRSSLYCVPHFSDRTLQTLKSHGVECLPELIERRDVAKLVGMLGLPSSEAHKEVLALIQGMPKLRVRIELRVLDPEDPAEEAAAEGEEYKKRRKGRLVMEPYKVPLGADLEINVILQYENQPMKFVHAPRFPKKKTYAWWVILGDDDPEIDELVESKKVLMPARARDQVSRHFVFQAPGDEADLGETFTLSLFVMSDSFFGLDQQIDMAITVVQDQS